MASAVGLQVEWLVACLAAARLEMASTRVAPPAVKGWVAGLERVEAEGASMQVRGEGGQVAAVRAAAAMVVVAAGVEETEAVGKEGAETAVADMGVVASA